MSRRKTGNKIGLSDGRILHKIAHKCNGNPRKCVRTPKGDIYRKYSMARRALEFKRRTYKWLRRGVRMIKVVKN